MCIHDEQPLISITQIQYINVQQILVVTFEFTGAARGFMIMSCAAREVKKVGQHWFNVKNGGQAATLLVKLLGLLFYKKRINNAKRERKLNTINNLQSSVIITIDIFEYCFTKFTKTVTVAYNRDKITVVKLLLFYKKRITAKRERKLNTLNNLQSSAIITI